MAPEPKKESGRKHQKHICEITNYLILYLFQSYSSSHSLCVEILGRNYHWNSLEVTHIWRVSDPRESCLFPSSFGFHLWPLLVATQDPTVVASWAAGYGLPLSETWWQPHWWPPSLSSPGTTRRAGPNLWHGAHEISASTASSSSSSSTPVALSIDVASATFTSSRGISSQVDSWGGAVVTRHAYRGWRDNKYILFKWTWIWTT